jgi:hypothetical protein
MFFVLVGSHQLVSESSVFLLNSNKCLPKRTGFPQKKPDIRQHKKIKEQEFSDPHHHHVFPIFLGRRGSSKDRKDAIIISRVEGKSQQKDGGAYEKN